MKTFGFWKPIIISLIVTPFALLLGIASAGAGHENYFWAKILFPYTMLSTFFFQSITIPFILLTIVQFPPYGFLLAVAGERKRLGPLGVVMAVVHILGVMLCLILPSENFS